MPCCSELSAPPLRVLDLQGNKPLAAASEDGWRPLGGCTQLTRLSLRGCRLPALPTALAELCSLATLDVGFNYPLQDLGPWLTCLTALTQLDATQCPLEQMPSLSALPQLKKFLL